MTHVALDDSLAGELKLMAVWFETYRRDNRLLQAVVVTRMSAQHPAQID